MRIVKNFKRNIAHVSQNKNPDFLKYKETNIMKIIQTKTNSNNAYSNGTCSSCTKSVKAPFSTTAHEKAKTDKEYKK